MDTCITKKETRNNPESAMSTFLPIVENLEFDIVFFLKFGKDKDVWFISQFLIKKSVYDISQLAFDLK